MRHALRPNAARRQVVGTASMPAPTEGWDTSSPVATMKPTRARVLDNWFPNADTVELRNGYKATGDTGIVAPVESLMTYGATKLFAAVGSRIVDYSTPTVVAVSSLTSARFQSVNFATSGGQFLWICNGANVPRYYDGTAWNTTTITGIPGGPSNIVGVDAYKGRLWLVMNSGTKVAYLAPDTIQGTATTFELGGEMTLGGYIMAVCTWTLDGGDGPDDYIVFITSRGQIIVYQGEDPASSTTFTKVGRYDRGAPIGRRCVTKVGGDVAVICVDGVVPLTRLVQTDRAATSNATLTQRIQRAMNDAAKLYAGNFGWQLTPYPRGTRAILNVPLVEGGTTHQYVMNTLTGAWCRFIGQNAACWAVFNDSLYFGGQKGVIYQADVVGPDLDADMTADMQFSFQRLGGTGDIARYTMAQPLITNANVSNIAVGVDTDYLSNAEMSWIQTYGPTGALWGTAIWGVDVWASPPSPTIDWVSINGVGQNAAFRMKATVPKQPAGVVARVPYALKLNGVNMAFERGGVL